MATALDNANPVVRERTSVRRKEEAAGAQAAFSGSGLAAVEREPIDSIEVFEHIRDIADPGEFCCGDESVGGWTDVHRLDILSDQSPPSLLTP